MPIHPLLDGIELDGRTGLEIGALHHPLVVDLGAKVLYVDHAPTGDLQAKYADDPDVGDMVDVDIVWGDQPLRPALDRTLGQGELVDFVVASHVIEHVPDLVSWLTEIADVLRPGGVLALAVPDKRFCFDARRRTSDVADIIEAHFTGRTRPSLAATFDFWTRYDSVDTAALWGGAAPPPPAPLRDREALERTREAMSGPEYRDVHCWVFTPASFLEALRRLTDLALFPDLVLRSFRPTAPGHLEFFAVFERPATEADGSDRRAAQLAAIDAAIDDMVAAPGPAEYPLPPEVAAFRASAREQRAILLKRRLLESVRRVLPR
jgi:SAM-dependent methyltransferase